MSAQCRDGRRLSNSHATSITDCASSGAAPRFRQSQSRREHAMFSATDAVLHYLARYTHRVAISNHRLVDVTDAKVTFRWKDYARGSRQRTMAVGGEEF